MIKSKFYILIISTMIFFSFQSCVQKAYEKTVIYRLHTEKLNNINSVGLRGSEKPLSWKKDLPMKVIQQDSLYEVTVTYLTGYKFTEAKFVINDTFELKNQPNRRIQFSEKDTTIYEVTFDVTK